jgi:hypothetical protein
VCSTPWLLSSRLWESSSSPACAYIVSAERCSAFAMFFSTSAEGLYSPRSTWLKYGFENVAAFSLVMLARCLTWLDRFGEAEAYAREALVLAREHRLRFRIAAALWHVGTVATLWSEAAPEQWAQRQARAARILGFADHVLMTMGERNYGSAQQAHEQPIDALRNTLGSLELAKLMTEGATMTEEQALEEVSAL